MKKSIISICFLTLSACGDGATPGPVSFKADDFGAELTGDRPTWRRCADVRVNVGSFRDTFGYDESYTTVPYAENQNRLEGARACQYAVLQAVEFWQAEQVGVGVRVTFEKTEGDVTLTLGDHDDWMLLRQGNEIIGGEFIVDGCDPTKMVQVVGAALGLPHHADEQNIMHDTLVYDQQNYRDFMLTTPEQLEFIPHCWSDHP